MHVRAKHDRAKQIGTGRDGDSAAACGVSGIHGRLEGLPGKRFAVGHGTEIKNRKHKGSPFSKIVISQ